MIKKIVIAFTVILSFNLGFAQEINVAKLDSLFHVLEANNKFMGSVAVSKNGNTIYAKSVGFLSVEDSIKANKSTKYRIGSISKTFTAVLVLKAVEEQKLNLNETINNYFPTVKNAHKITIGNLLNHRSGIYNFTNDPQYLTYNTQPKTQSEMVEIISAKDAVFEPDTKAEYSNSNYVLLTYILEKAFEKPFAELLKIHITTPLGLENTYMGGNINTSANECQSYRFTGSWQLESETHSSIPLGAGAIVSTPIDLVKFSDALFSGKVLKNESLTLMKTVKDNYGIGLFQIPFYNQIGYGHTGGIDAFSSVFAHFPEAGVSYALTSNGTNYNNNDISIAVLSAVFNQPFTIPQFKKIDLKPEELAQYLGVYASKQLPFKITITINEKTLMAQATNQPSFPLEAIEKHIFGFSLAGLTLEFNLDENTMILKQAGGSFQFTKE
jgi:CubicO group peptidase (beta-lactamase class C family)